MSLLSVELSRERIRELERRSERRHLVARARAVRRARRGALIRAIRLSGDVRPPH
ncbi:hypothetical protein [Actinomadura craniellae]|nr:hypothetical protein [Actinomadura craniellae]